MHLYPFRGFLLLEAVLVLNSRYVYPCLRVCVSLSQGFCFFSVVKNERTPKPMGKHEVFQGHWTPQLLDACQNLPGQHYRGLTALSLPDLVALVPVAIPALRQ